MLEFTGKFGTAKIMIDEIDQATIGQIYEFLNNEFFTNQIRIMPDAHYGNGVVVGFTMPLTDKIIPNIVGVDIGCGMLFFIINKNILGIYKRHEIDDIIRTNIPFGKDVFLINLKTDSVFWHLCNTHLRLFVMSYNSKYNTSYPIDEYSYEWLQKKCDDIGMDFGRAIKSLGTLGSGNHFIEFGKSQNTGDYAFTIHSGSRQFGLKIANYWQKKAGKGLSALQGDDMFEYLKDMVFAQYYASENRRLMCKQIVDNLHLTIDEKSIISTTHNYINFNDFIIRKGSISSYKNQKMIIPFNMEDGLLICEGKSNPDWNYSAPHGAGRVGARRWAKENLDLDKAKHNMESKNIYASHLPKDELKGAYKDPSIIENAIGPTATIIDRVKPVLAMKD